MKRELLIKELKRVREELVERGASNHEMNSGSAMDDNFKRIIDNLEDANLIKYTETDITLADFLGWEEGVEYEHDGVRFKIEDNKFYTHKVYSDTGWGEYYISINHVKGLRNAKKVEKRYIVPLPNLKTSDGEQQYLTNADNTFFASRWDKDLRQTWKEEHLKYIPEEYRKHAVELKGAE